MLYDHPAAMRSARLRVSPGQSREVVLVPDRGGMPYYDTYLHVLRLRSRQGGRLPDGRPVGAFVTLQLVMGPSWAAQ